VPSSSGQRAQAEASLGDVAPFGGSVPVARVGRRDLSVTRDCRTAAGWRAGQSDAGDSPQDPTFFGGRPDLGCLQICLLVIFRVQLRHGRRESSEQTVGIVVDSRREEQRGAR
jgi:hypothetical protein